VLILISSLTVWNNTPPNLIEIKEGKSEEEDDQAEGEEHQEDEADEGDKEDEKNSED